MSFKTIYRLNKRKDEKIFLMGPSKTMYEDELGFAKRDFVELWEIDGIIQGNMLKQEEQFSYIRKLSNFKSTQALLKGYNKRSSSALNIRGGRKYTNYPLMKNKI